MPYTTLPLSEPFHPPGARPAGAKPDPRERMRVTVVLRSRSPEAETAAALASIATQLPHERRALSRREFEKQYGASPADLELVKSFARLNGLRVVEASAARRCVVLSGTLAAVGRAFRTTFAGYEDDSGSYRSHTGPISLPADIAGVIDAVLGLDDRPLLQRHGVVAGRPSLPGEDPRAVARAYAFPPGLDGRGQTVAIIELGGGFHPADLKNSLAWRGLRHPAVRVRRIDRSRNRPAPPQDLRFVLDRLGLPASKSGPASRGPRRAVETRTLKKSKSYRQTSGATISREDAQWAMWTIEATMDIELIASLANGAALEVYFAPGTAHGQYHALTAALDSPQNPSVISCSFGSCEDQLPPAYLRVMDRTLRLAALKGVTVCVSSGDKGADVQDGRPRVHFPASSPHVLACGGTHLDSAPPFGEIAWEEPGMPALKSGGGVSGFFAEPSWQSTAQVQRKTGRSGRGVPDVAAKADLKTGYGIVVDGTCFPMGGTSAAAPLWAALVARLNQKLGTPIGYLTPLLYTPQFRGATRDITRGTNGVFRASRGWDACTGWGSPNGMALLAALDPDAD
ncbi:MAG: S53 family peptidase [Acidobacteriota bacterium]